MSISYKYAQELNKQWKENGDLPCDHSKIEKEKNDRGADTGDYVCTTCGEAHWGKDWNKTE